MSLKSLLAIPFAKIATKKVYKWANNPHKTQEKVFKNLIETAKNTAFGKDHHFDKITTYDDFKKYFDIYCSLLKVNYYQN